MGEIGLAFSKAAQLILARDPELIEIMWRSLRIAGTSTSLASLLCIPLGSLIHFHSFPGKRALINIIQTFYSFPTVAVGLLMFVLFSRVGPFGGLGIMFSPTLMVIGQIVLISPILLGLTISALSAIDPSIKEATLSLGATSAGMMWVILREARFAVIGAVVMGFGRAISEVGLSLMIGGNIRGYTRVLTTAISLEAQKGELELAIALGIILIALALIVNISLNMIQEKYS